MKKSEKYLFIGILLVGVLVSFISYKTVTDGITRSTVKREKLKITEEFDDNCVDTDTDYLSDSQHTSETLKAFYEDTGVQPYVYVVGKQGFGIESATEKYLKENKLGSNDMLFVYERIEPKKGISYITTGKNASKVIDDEAKSIMLDLMEQYVSEIPSLDACITKTFYDTSEVIMGKPKIPAFVFPIMVMVVDFVVLALVYFKVIVLGRRKKVENRKTRTDERKLRGY